MRAKIVKREGKQYLQLPEQFADASEAELFLLRDRFWLISPPLPGEKGEKPEKKEKKSAQPPGAGPARAEKALSAEENAVLQKLLAVRFQGRTPSMVEKLFTSEEKAIIQQLIKRGFIQVFYGGKYEKQASSTSRMTYSRRWAAPLSTSRPARMLQLGASIPPRRSSPCRRRRPFRPRKPTQASRARASLLIPSFPRRDGLS